MAQSQIGPRVHRTPVHTSGYLDRRTGAQVFCKAESFQRGGSFKVRGAMNVLSSLDLGSRQQGVVAFSSGNHAQGVAIAAAEFGIPATIVMPEDAPCAKIRATQSYGAQIRFYNRQTEDREALAQQIAARQGSLLIPPYDDPRIMVGQGTCALEFLEQVPELDALVVPLGGGGLLSGCALVAKALNPTMRLYGVEPETGNDYFLSLQKGERVWIPLPNTLADGIRTTCPGQHTFPVIQRYVDEVVLVSDADILRAMQLLLTRMKLVIEPTGAVGIAALLAQKIVLPRQRIGVILSGGNVDAEILTLALNAPNEN
ncbi:pyridoxal-phosphate dependent enzyme [Synechococcus bigranulatus str. 'Rupite']|uniref:Pyridoxal-phosphate dependent enzyme n=1 Tax=Thermostichus vulcanus str. 'Rupite' TaxID=2813851 RepID=A0ABT0CAN9_THEVL|nr:pyridoxal-phosphate dependent enzyme [Thermostichus vulcanus str. 'Rupite']